MVEVSSTRMGLLRSGMGSPEFQERKRIHSNKWWIRYHFQKRHPLARCCHASQSVRSKLEGGGDALEGGINVPLHLDTDRVLVTIQGQDGRCDLCR